MTRAWPVFLPLALCMRAHAQDAVSITAAFDTARWLPPETEIAFTLSRPLQPMDGRLAVLVGGLDVSALLTAVGDRTVYRPRTLPLPSGEHEVAVYVVRGADEWLELARWPLRVLKAGGFKKASLVPRLTFNNKGQVAAGQTPAAEPVQRTRFQDFAGNFGMQTVLERVGWAVRSQSNYMGVSRREEALRFGQKGVGAPRIDLSDYLITIERGPLALRLGDVAFGTHRYLISGLQNRGVATDLAIARFARVSLAGLSGSRMVGWSDLFGIGRAQHRILSGNLALDLSPTRPGLAQLEAGVVDGRVLPEAGFTQGAVNDRELSRGAAFRLALQDPTQRARLEAGYTRSRFTNPADPLLAQGNQVVPVDPETRGAQYIDLNVNVLRNIAITDALPLNVRIVGRHERVDPLFRTVAMPGIKADLLQNLIEISGNLGAAALQVSHTRSHDNLDGIPTILSTRTRASQATVALPFASLVGRAPDWLPMLSGGLTRLHQFGLGTPSGSESFPAFVPDQISTTQTVSLLSQTATWKAQLQFNRSLQDNRQTQRERADFPTLARVVSLVLTPTPALTLALDLGSDAARAAERSEETDTRRAGGSLTWRPGSMLSFDTGLMYTRITDTPRTFLQSFTDARFELSSSLPLLRTRTASKNAQVFLRYGLHSSLRKEVAARVASTRNWTLNTGLTLSFF
jgi:hypothetical protein